MVLNCFEHGDDIVKHECDPADDLIIRAVMCRGLDQRGQGLEFT